MEGLLHSDGGNDFTSDERSTQKAWIEKGGVWREHLYYV